MTPPSLPPGGRPVLLLLAAIVPRLAVAAPDAASQPAPAAPASPSASPASHRHDPTPAARRLLREAIDLYVVGRYQHAAAVLRPLVEARVLKDRADQLEALRIYGTALFLAGAKVGADRAFRHLLRLDPRARLDPSFVRPEVVRFFEGVRRRFASEHDAIARRSAPKGSALANLLVPWGQFRNGHRVKGYSLLFSELALAATSITTAALLYSWRSPTGEFGERESAAEPLTVVNIVSFSALAGLLLYGVVDGLYFYYRGPRPALDQGSQNRDLSYRLQSGFHF